MKTLAIFGGSFNPVHAGHIALCRGCDATYHFDRFLLIPDNLPPHKTADELVSNDDRMNMLRLAVSKFSRFEVSDIEYRLGGKSYTDQTVAALKEEYPGWKIYLLIGSDMLFTFRKWHNYQALLQEVTVIAADRHQEDKERLISCKEGFGKFSSSIELLFLPVIDVSSSEIRALIRQGKDPGERLDRDVYRYIKEHGLYRDGKE